MEQPIKEPSEQGKVSIVDHANAMSNGINKAAVKLTEHIEQLAGMLTQAGKDIEALKERIAVLSSENEELKKAK